MGNEELVEAVLFSAGKPLRIADLEQITGLESKLVRKALSKLSRAYKTRSTSLEIAKIGPKYSLQLKEEYAHETEQVAKTELDHDILKTAAIIAYYQPMKKRKLVEMLGDKAKGHVFELADRNLITERRTNRGFILETTDKFFEFFGLEMTKKEDLKQMLAARAGLLK